MNIGGENPGVPQRPPASAYMLVDSLDRYGKFYPNENNFTSSSDWKLNFQTPVIQGYFTRLCLTQVNFNWNIPTILFNYNDLMLISVLNTPDADLQTITLSPGFYTPTTLAAQIQSKCVTAFPNSSITCVWDPLLGCFTLATGVVGGFIGIIGNTAPSGSSVIMRRVRCLQTLGFANVAISGPNPTDNSVSGNCPTMLATRFVDICSSFLTKYQRVKDGTTLVMSPRQDMICRLFAVAPNTRYNITANDSPGSTPFTIVQDMNNPKFFKWSPDETISNFDIEVRDEYGEILPVQQSFCSEYQLTFMVSET